MRAEAAARLERVKSAVEALADPMATQPVQKYWLPHKHPMVEKESGRLRQLPSKEALQPRRSLRHRGTATTGWLLKSTCMCGWSQSFTSPVMVIAATARPWTSPLWTGTRTCLSCCVSGTAIRPLWQYREFARVAVTVGAARGCADASRELVVRTVMPAAKLWCAF